MFIADAMLGRLAKRLRLIGFDVLYDPALADNDILRISLEQGRVLLTRDTGLASRPLARNHLLITSDHVDDQLRQVLEAFSLPATGPSSRCSACNGVLKPLDRNDARNSVPEHIYATICVFFHCGQCRRDYWQGSHVRNVEGRLRFD
jgi:uncharacterized protein with PIN domain